MSKTFTSPYATAFNSAIKRGTPCGVAVNNIAKRTGKNPQNVFASLFKAGHCQRQKFNGQFIYWPSNWNSKSNASQRNECQTSMWQCFVDWCIASGNCTPEKLNNNSSQNEFMAFCKKFFGKQYSVGTSSKNSSRTRSSSSSKRSLAKASKRSATPKKRTSSKSNKKITTKAKKKATKSSSKKRSTSTKSKRSTSIKAKRTSASKAKRSTSIKAKRATASKAKRSTSYKTKSRTTTRKNTTRKSSPSSYKFPTSRSTSIRKAA
ncbi:MAG: hypothetical protein O7G85_16700 [Planctomycetota bacterium]|nr:hypothetical protein [Planctomycetota bacterium]